MCLMCEREEMLAAYRDLAAALAAGRLSWKALANG